MRMLRRHAGSAVLAVLLLGALPACQTGDQASGGYPSLRSVPETPRASLPLEDRRKIVRDLIEERDRSREQTAIVRDRSGLGAAAAPAGAEDSVLAEDVVADAPDSDKEPFRLRPDPSNKVPADSVYRSESTFEDGSLDDFIRQLKRDTQPQASPEPLDEGEPVEDETSFLPLESESGSHSASEATSPLVLAAFAPAARQSPSAAGGPMIRPAAADEEPGFFCSYLGWSVAWSSMCVDDSNAQPEPEDDQGVVADVEPEPETEAPSDPIAPEQPARSAPRSADDARQERIERRLSEEDAAEAIEDAGRNALAPVVSSLDKLRDYIRSRRSDGGDVSSPERFRPGSPQSEDAALDRVRPLIPRSRPERREDITIVDRGERFDFYRTPTPAFKPTPDDETTVILPPERPRRPPPAVIGRPDPPPRPLARPDDLLIERRDDVAEPAQPDVGETLQNEAIALALPDDADALPEDVEQDGEPRRAFEERPPSSSPEPSSVVEPVLESEARPSLPTPALETPSAPEAELEAEPEAEPEAEDVTLLTEPGAGAEAPSSDGEPFLILFQPDRPALPADAATRLADLLATAEEEGKKIHIIGEAGTNYLARRRATDVGAALVQLGATAEVLEYDHEARPDVDQVRLLLKPAEPNPLFPEAVEK